jgi:histidyl-tRNA synthetase
LGLERTLLILQAQAAELPTVKPLDVYVIGLGEAAEKEVTKLLQQLRLAGLRAEKDYLGRKIKAQMKSADRFKAAFVAILGEDELARGEITVKAMATGEQQTVPLEQVAEALKKKSL